MWKLLKYYGKYQSARGVMGGMPGWARVVIFLAALPGIAAILLSILALLVSILALLLLTVPIYQLLNWLVGAPAEQEDEETEMPRGDDQFVDPVEPVDPSTEFAGENGSMTVSEPAPTVDEPPARPRRQIDIKIIE